MMDVGMIPFLASMLVAAAGPPDPDAPIVEDRFGRSLAGPGLILTDWEGYMANPAIKLRIRPPAGATFPARATLTADDSRISFDLPSEAGPHGPRKVISFDGPAAVAVAVAIFPDRDGRDEDHTLRVEFADARAKTSSLTLAVHVADQDRDRPASFPILLDFAQDRTGFFRDEAWRAVAVQAANDWAAFFDGEGLRPVQAGAEATMIWNPDGFNTSRTVTNAEGYTGFRLHAYGIDSDLLRSGGEPSRLGGFQSRGVADLPIRRSGGLEVEVKGNYNRKGWLIDLADSEWWKATNLGGVANDLYSIAHHEIGHALAFNPANRTFPRGGVLRDEAIRAYLGAEPAADRSDHFTGIIDPASLRGAFGNEYHGRMPKGRWLITKLDLLCARAIGYPLRATSAFATLSVTTEDLPAGVASAPYSARIRAAGGIPAYQWEVVHGALPGGLTLDSFSGEIRGIPDEPGTFGFTVRVRDSDEREPGTKRAFRIEIARG